MVWRHFAGRFAVPLVTIFSTVVYAYPTQVDFDGTVLRWKSPKAIYLETVFEGDIDEEMVSAITWQAVDKWNSIPNVLVHIASVPENASASISIKFSATNGSESTAGYAIFDASDGAYPTHCSIEIYTADYISVDLAKTVLHEIGHCIGLGHSLVPEAIMSYRLDKNAFALDLDDVAAVSRLYPIDKKEAQLPLGCAVGSGGAPEGRGHGTLLLWMILPLIWARKELWSAKRSIA